MSTKKHILALKAKAKKTSRALSLDGLKANQIAVLLAPSRDAFLASAAWTSLRVGVINRYGAKCMCCGSLKAINVDHIKPRLHFPELSLCEDNLQVLCGRCNKSKGNKHYTDYRIKNLSTKQE